MKIYIGGIEKSVQKWDAEKGTEIGGHRVVLSEGPQGMFPDLDSALKKLSSKFGIPSKKSDWLAFEDGRIICSRAEDSEGNPESESDAKYLADYDIFLEFVPEMYEPSPEQMSKEFKIEQI